MNEQTAPSAAMQDIVIDSFRREDALGVAQLFRAVYGDGYPIKAFYDPAELITANMTGRIISTVARTDAGEIIGHEAFVRSAPYEKLYEAGAGLVLPAYRRRGLMVLLMEYSFQVDLKRADAEETFGEPVCNHVALQKIVVSLGHSESALEVDLMPAETYTKEQSARGRVSTLLTFGTVKPKPHVVYLPTAYRSEIEWFYAGLNVEREFVWVDSTRHAENASVGKMAVFDFAQVARIAIHRIGADFDAFTARLESEARTKGVQVFQMWLPLASPFTGVATDILRARGYFLGGILPRWFDEDGLLMQEMIHEPNWEGIVLYSERAKRIMEIVKGDWEKVKRET
jgi:GNAT superfamily N-acetyltransferase